MPSIQERQIWDSTLSNETLLCAIQCISRDKYLGELMLTKQHVLALLRGYVPRFLTVYFHRLGIEMPISCRNELVQGGQKTTNQNFPSKRCETIFDNFLKFLEFFWPFPEEKCSENQTLSYNCVLRSNIRWNHSKILFSDSKPFLMQMLRTTILRQLMKLFLSVAAVYFTADSPSEINICMDSSNWLIVLFWRLLKLNIKIVDFL